jgi:hypothetical protein
MRGRHLAVEIAALATQGFPHHWLLPTSHADWRVSYVFQISYIRVATSQKIQAITTGHTKSWERKIPQHQRTRIPTQKTKEPWARQCEACGCWRLRNISESRKGSKFESKNGGRVLRTWQRTRIWCNEGRNQLRVCFLSDDGMSCVAFRNQRNKEVIQPSVSPPIRLTNNFKIPLLKVNLIYATVTKVGALGHRGCTGLFPKAAKLLQGPRDCM